MSQHCPLHPPPTPYACLGLRKQVLNEGEAWSVRWQTKEPKATCTSALTSQGQKAQVPTCQSYSPTLSVYITTNYNDRKECGEVTWFGQGV